MLAIFKVRGKLTSPLARILILLPSFFTMPLCKRAASSITAPLLNFRTILRYLPRQISHEKDCGNPAWAGDGPSAFVRLRIRLVPSPARKRRPFVPCYLSRMFRHDRKHLPRPTRLRFFVAPTGALKRTQIHMLLL